MAGDIKGTALVTGASSGIGAVYADRLAHRGYDLILVARNAGRLDALARRLRAETGRAVEALPADLARQEGVAHIGARLAADAAITMLVNNAGLALNGGLLQSSAAEIENLIAVNITAPTLLAAAAGKAFVARRAGAIINIASVLALLPEAFEGVYSGSKAYLLNLSLKLALDVRDAGVRVQAVLPGATRTEIWERAGKATPDSAMAVDDLVDAALTGFDRGEEVTIPALPDDGQWVAYNAARLAMAPNLSRPDLAPRYRHSVPA